MPPGPCTILLSSYNAKLNSLIAQLVERRTVNPQVPGSSPGRGARTHEGPQPANVAAFFLCTASRRGRLRAACARQPSLLWRSDLQDRVDQPSWRGPSRRRPVSLGGRRCSRPTCRPPRRGQHWTVQVAPAVKIVGEPDSSRRETAYRCPEGVSKTHKLFELWSNGLGAR
jgi:hypothetical protein